MKIPKEMILKQFENGPMQNFQYLVGDAATKQVAVVDPAWDIDVICGLVKKNGYAIQAVFLTHGHPDHVNGLAEILKRHNVPAYVSKHESPFFKPRHKNLIEVDNHAKLKIGNIEFECLSTPGHSPGCQCFLYENVLISGDAIFIDGCGRCDLPGSDPKQQYHSLYNVIMKLPDNTLIFPGHDYGPTPFANLGEQKKTNPYLNCHNQNEFLRQRMGVFI